MTDTIEIDRSRHEMPTKTLYKYTAGYGLTEEVVRKISSTKNEPDWMLQLRLDAFKAFKEKPMPNWEKMPDLSKLDLEKITYYQSPDAKPANKWEDVPTEIKDTFEKLGIPEAERKALAGVGSQFDCLTGDSLVYTNPRGAKKIKEIKVGDTVFSWDAKSNQIVKSKVTGFMNKGKRNVFQVTVAGRTIKVTANHPFLALIDRRKPGRQRARYSKEWTYLSDLKEGDLIAIATDLPDCGSSYEFPPTKIKQIGKGRNQTDVKYDLPIEYKYKKITLPRRSDEDIMWFLGLYLGDGCIGHSFDRDRVKVEIAIPQTQPELRAEVRRVSKKIFDTDLKCPDEYRVSFYSTILGKFIENIGFSGKALTKKIPDWVFTLPKKQKLAFLGGYLDADGAVRASKTAKTPFFTSVNKSLLEQIKELCTYCGIQSSRITQFSSGLKNKNGKNFIGYRLHLSGNITRILSRYPPKRDRLFQHKYAGSQFRAASGTTIRNYCSDSVGFARIKSIHSLGHEEVFDISVENYKNFVARGVVVHNSEVVYHNLKKEVAEKGVIFEDLDVALREHEDLVKKHFSKCINIHDHKFISLHYAVWSGGTFIYVPKGVKIDLPLQAYFRMNTQSAGQFEHTLIVVDEGAEVNYIEGCSAPRFETSSLHAGGVEIFVGKNARARYNSVENWSKNTFNLNTKRAIVEENGKIEWIGGQLGSQATMLYPCSILKGRGSKADHISIAFATEGQDQDTGAKIYHLAPNTTSTVKSKSISQKGGRTNYRGHLFIKKGATGAKTSVECDALMFDDLSKTDTMPYMDIREQDVEVAHEARVGKISDENIFYLMSRGLTEEEAVEMIVSGFMEPITKELPLEYAVELNKLITLEIEGSLG